MLRVALHHSNSLSLSFSLSLGIRKYIEITTVESNTTSYPSFLHNTGTALDTGELDIVTFSHKKC